MGAAVQMLTGAPYFDTYHASMTTEELWNYLGEKLAANWVITCASHVNSGSHDNLNALGIADRHAYSVLDTYELSNGQKLVKVRNPWGGASGGGTE